MLSELVRPKLLAQVRNQPAAIRFLSGWLRMYKEPGTSDAFLISGPSGTGKTSIAHALAGELGVDPYSFDTILAADCNLATVREVRDRLALAAWGKSRWRLVLVDEAHTMSIQARNAWLSLLECLPKFRVIVFTTTEPQAFDDIWRSRCKHLKLEQHAQADLERLLEDVARDQGQEIDTSVSAPIAQEAKGNARAALQSLEMYLLSGEAPKAVQGAPQAPEPASVVRAYPKLTGAHRRCLVKLLDTKGRPWRTKPATLHRLAGKGLVRPDGDQWILTQKGREIACTLSA